MNLQPTSFTNPPDQPDTCMEFGCHHTEAEHGWEEEGVERVCRRCNGTGVTPQRYVNTGSMAACFLCQGKGCYVTSAWVPKCKAEGCTCQGFSDVDTSEDPRKEYGYGR